MIVARKETCVNKQIINIGFTHFGVCVSSNRLPSWNSWDLLRCSAVKPGSRWMSLRLGGGGVPGALTLFLRRMGGVPGGVMVLTTKGVRGGVCPKCLWRGDGGRERWPVSKGGKSPVAGPSTVSLSAYRGGARACGLWHMCWLYLDWTLGLWESWNLIHWLASGWQIGVFSLPDSEVGHWMDQSCLVWLPVGRAKDRDGKTTGFDKHLKLHVLKVEKVLYWSALFCEISCWKPLRTSWKLVGSLLRRSSLSFVQQ